MIIYNVHNIYKQLLNYINHLDFIYTLGYLNVYINSKINCYKLYIIFISLIKFEPYYNVMIYYYFIVLMIY